MERSYSAAHIRLAILVEESGLCTPDFLDIKGEKTHKYYLMDERYKEKVEQARRFIFDELPELPAEEFRKKLWNHLFKFFNLETAYYYNRIITILSSLITRTDYTIIND